MSGLYGLGRNMLGCAEIVSVGMGVVRGDGVLGGLQSGETNSWAHQDSNLGPSDYESDALTN